MHVSNVHRREIAAPAGEVGALVDSLASDDDRLWPHENWPPMRFDRPGLVVGASGGHGPIGYRVAHHEPGRSAAFEFTGRPRGLAGGHVFSVQPSGPGRCVLWHVLDMELRGTTLLAWRLFIRPMHDAIAEDALDKAEAQVGRPGTASRWTPWVRLLRRRAPQRVRAAPPGAVLQPQ